MLGCCLFIPLVLLMIVAPMLAAGRGWAWLLATAVGQLVVVAIIAVINLAAISNAMTNWNTQAEVALPFMAIMLGPIALGWLVVWAKRKEERDQPNLCRVCGYDLRATPVRCPECGTLVRHDPDRF
jgi:hypothetical protein